MAYDFSEAAKMTNAKDITKLTFREVFEIIKKDMEVDCTYWRIVGFVENPKGIKQDSEGYFNHEYVDQSSGGPHGDYFSGDVYFPFGNEYLVVEYYD